MQPVIAIEGLTKTYDCKILFNEGIYEVVKDMVPCVELGLDYVKGRAEAVRLYGIPDEWIRTSAEDLLEGATAVGAR